jgi:hypothetical protein
MKTKKRLKKSIDALNSGKGTVKVILKLLPRVIVF